MPGQTTRSNKLKRKKPKASSPKLSLGVHFMPKTSEKSFQTWFVIGALIFILIIVILLILI